MTQKSINKDQVHQSLYSCLVCNVLGSPANSIAIRDKPLSFSLLGIEDPSGYAQIISLQVVFKEFFMFKVEKIRIFVIFHFFEVYAKHEFSAILSCIALVFFLIKLIHQVFGSFEEDLTMQV